MKPLSKHNHISAIDRQSKAFFSDGKFNWKKSKHDIWSELEVNLTNQTLKRFVKIHFNTGLLAIAASFLIVMGLASFFRFYTIQIITPLGQHQLVDLPDGSTIQLNAESSLKYQPYWWRFNRQLNFAGEGLFKVKKGKKFRVNSLKGTTEVLGTRFNIFSRDEIYKVTCLSGSVRVTSITNQQAILQPNSKAEIEANGQIKVQHQIDTFPEVSWEKNIFLFTASPVMEVFYEIERQYGVKISAKIDTYALYSGNFTRSHSVEEVLSYVCPALGLKFDKKSHKEYFITPESE